MSEPEPEQEHETAKTEPELPPISAEVEPVPEWSSAVHEWGGFWHVHIYGLGTLYLLIAIKSIFCIVRMACCKSSTQRKKVHLASFILLLMFSLSRALFLLIDAYQSKRKLPLVAIKLLWGIAQPCLITSYVLLFVVLKNALLMKQRFRHWYTVKNITIITLPYFIFVLAAEMTISFFHELIGFVFACQLLYVGFTIFLITFYSFISLKIWQNKRDIGTSSFGQQNGGQRSRLKYILLVCGASIVGGILLCISQIYAIVGVYGVFSTARAVPPWPWFCLNTVQRVLELYMCLLLLLILSKKSDNGRHQVSFQSSRHGDVVVTRQLFVVSQLHTKESNGESVDGTYNRT